MQPEQTIGGTRSQVVGKLALYVKPDGSLMIAMGNQMTHMIVSPDEARSLFDYILQYARYFEQASNGHKVNTELLTEPEGQEQKRAS